VKVRVPTSCRPIWTSTSPPTNAAIAVIESAQATTAGTSRLSRRTRKLATSIDPVRSISRTSSVVMRNPETTKKTSTPRLPAGAQAGQRW
jgi:hypothetical protein